MIYEYALDPRVVAVWAENRRDCDYFSETFGLGQPRQVSRYPKSWKGLAWDAYKELDDNTKLRFTELLSRLMENAIRRSKGHYDGGDWFDNALNAHSEIPFQAIISTINTVKEPFVLNPETISTHSLWMVPRTVVVPRRAKEMAFLLEPLLSSATEIQFIDPYFGPEIPRYRKTFKAFLASVNTNRKSELERVEIHTKVKSSEQFFQTQCLARLKKLIPKGMRVSFVRWTEKEDNGQAFHNRYVLTNIGGVSFQHGLDEGKVGETDDVAILDFNAYKTRWEQFGRRSEVFEREGVPFELVGE